MSMLTLFLNIFLFYFDKIVKEDVKPIAGACITRTLTVYLLAKMNGKNKLWKIMIAFIFTRGSLWKEVD